MRCEDCPYLMVPFFSCIKHKWLLDDGKTVVEGCNIDGRLPPLQRISTESFKVELNAYQQGRAQERFKWAIRDDRFTNPESPYFHKTTR